MQVNIHSKVLMLKFSNYCVSHRGLIRTYLANLLNCLKLSLRIERLSKEQVEGQIYMDKSSSMYFSDMIFAMNFCTQHVYKNTICIFDH